jgi:hypothetical protein
VKESILTEVTMDVNLTENDLYKFSLKQTYMNFGMISLGITGILGLFLLPSIAWNAITQGIKPPVQTIFLLFFTAVTIFLPLGLKRNARKLMETNKFLQQTQHYKINTEEVLVTSETGEGHISWDKVFKVREEKHYFAIYISKAQAYLLPIRCFNNPNDVNTLRNIVKKSLVTGKQVLM